MKRHGARGFTLVEVLVALGIVAIALLAGLQATAALTRNAQRQSDVLLAQLCAENELVKVRLAAADARTWATAASPASRPGAASTVRWRCGPRPTPIFGGSMRR